MCKKKPFSFWLYICITLLIHFTPHKVPKRSPKFIQTKGQHEIKRSDQPRIAKRSFLEKWFDEGNVRLLNPLSRRNTMDSRNGSEMRYGALSSCLRDQILREMFCSTYRLKYVMSSPFGEKHLQPVSSILIPADITCRKTQGIF